ncbi:MAG: hypothetical protein OXE59_11140 [Bacteroidetes bacterium]|nr:hypothetical protein [Bacteroidota bacterium]MCY4234278.1 hypothetical protein [Bacteroidota bacterium]
MDNQDQKPNSRDLRSSLNDGVEKIDKHIRELRQEISNVVPPVKDFMVKHPVGTLSTVFGIGFVIGCFIAGSQNNDD